LNAENFDESPPAFWPLVHILMEIEMEPNGPHSARKEDKRAQGNSSWSNGKTEKRWLIYPSGNRTAGPEISMPRLSAAVPADRNRTSFLQLEFAFYRNLLKF
jgi:hypothetical protein